MQHFRYTAKKRKIQLTRGTKKLMSRRKKLDRFRKSTRNNSLTSDRAVKDFSENLLMAMLGIEFLKMKFDSNADDRISKLIEDSSYHVEAMLVVQEEIVKPRLVGDANLDALTDILRTVNQNLIEATKF